MTDTIASPAPAGEDEPLYRKPLSPETAALLSAMEEKRTQPKKPKKAAGKKPGPKKHRRAPPHNAHVIAYLDHKQAVFIADFLARMGATAAGQPVTLYPADPAPYIAALGPDGWGIGLDTPQATSMGPGFSAPSVRIA